MRDKRNPDQGPACRRIIANWFEEEHDRLCRAVDAPLRRHFSEIPRAILESVLVEKDDVLQSAALRLLDKPHYARRLLTFWEASRLYAAFIRHCCKELSRKQHIRNRVDLHGANFELDAE